MRIQTLTAVTSAAGLALAVPALADGHKGDHPEKMMAESGVKLMAELLGSNETAGGDEDGSGMFTARLNPGSGQLCYRYEVDDIDDVSGAHIHRGGAGVDGEVVVPLEIADNGVAEACTAVDKDFALELINGKGEFYVNIHDDNYPNGALRGQLLK